MKNKNVKSSDQKGSSYVESTLSIDQLLDKQEKLITKYDLYYKAMNALNPVIYSDKVLKDAHNKLINTVSKISEDLEQIEYQIKDYQDNNCIHDWVYDSHDSHYDYEKCTICGNSRKC